LDIEFFNKKVRTETLSFPKSILANFLHIAEMIEEIGPDLGLPFTKPVGNGLFEIRAKGKEGIGRSIFCYVKKDSKKIVILHSFIKKSGKIPKKELEIAKRRKKEVDNE
jgi:phage-related protein